MASQGVLKTNRSFLNPHDYPGEPVLVGDEFFLHPVLQKDFLVRHFRERIFLQFGENTILLP